MRIIEYSNELKLGIITFVALIVTGCAGAVEPVSSNMTGRAVVTLSEIPADVYCMRITGSGSIRSEAGEFDVNPGETSAELGLEGLPLGEVSFQAEAFETACPALTTDSIPSWVSDPVEVLLLKGEVAQVALTMKRNGRSALSVDFPEDEVASACVEVNLALNTTGTGFPNPATDSDPGWGGGSYPWDTVDSAVKYYDTWEHGLAFTGGIDSWMGEPCGWRQATIDFGETKTFERVLVWHHGDEHIPTTYNVDYWDGSSWLPVGGTSSVRYDLRSSTDTWGAVPTENLFPLVRGSKVRFSLNNCDITHGWLYEFEVFGCL